MRTTTPPFTSHISHLASRISHLVSRISPSHILIYSSDHHHLPRIQICPSVAIDRSGCYPIIVDTARRAARIPLHRYLPGLLQTVDKRLHKLSEDIVYREPHITPNG